MKSQLQQKVVIQITIKYIGDISQCFCENANLVFLTGGCALASWWVCSSFRIERFGFALMTAEKKYNYLWSSWKTLTSIWSNSWLNPSIVLDREDHCFNQRFVQAEKKVKAKPARNTQAFAIWNKYVASERDDFIFDWWSPLLISKKIAFN